MTDLDIPDGDTTGLHAKVQQQLNDLINSGVPYAIAAEALFVVALVAKTKTDGTRSLARQLFLVAKQLAAVADQEEADAVKPKH